MQNDILRVEVTRVSSGSSQYSITLNNWFDSLPNGRVGASSNGSGNVEKRGGNGQPDLPRYKYNDFKALCFGNRLRIEMGYRRGQSAESGFVPMIAGPITEMRFSFADAGAQLTVSGEDDLSTLKDSRIKCSSFPSIARNGIVEEVLKKSGFRLTTISKPLVEPEKSSPMKRKAFREPAKGPVLFGLSAEAGCAPGF